MCKAILGCLAVLFLSGAVPAFPQQQKNDVPKQHPGKRSPDLKQSKRQPPRGHSKETTPKHVNPGDVPHSQPDKRNPDSKQANPAPNAKGHA